jgi:predicted lipoprotein with Yx(FWY)xxD motif
MVSDQALVDDTVTIAEVISSGPGWIVIHADQNGSPGPVIGYTAVIDGINKDVVVKLDVSKVTAILYAMLHTDAGTVGTYEFPGPDGPVAVEGKVITPAFRITGGLPSAEAKAATVMVASSEQLGSFLVGPNGMTLYVFLKDTPNTSNCYNACAQNWPPLLVEGTPIAGEGVDASLLGVTQRQDGTTQVTYNGWPLYYFAGDGKPGDTNGQGVRDVWFVISPQGEKISMVSMKTSG